MSSWEDEAPQTNGGDHDRNHNDWDDEGPALRDEENDRERDRDRDRDERPPRDYDGRRSPRRDDRERRPPPAPRHVHQKNNTPNQCIGVFGLSNRTNAADLKDEFSRIGKVEKVDVIYDQKTGRSRGIGFIKMASVEEATAAVNELNGVELHGRNVRVDYSFTEGPHDPTPGKYMGRHEERRDYYRDRYDRPPPRRRRDYDDDYYDDRRRGRGGDRYSRRYDDDRYPPPRRHDDYDRPPPRRRYDDDYDRPPKRRYDDDERPSRRGASPPPAPRRRYED